MSAATMTGVQRTPTTALDILATAVLWLDASWPNGSPPTPTVADQMTSTTRPAATMTGVAP